MDYIEKVLKKTSWISILESIIFIVLGIIVIWKPEGTLKVISYILGFSFIIIGIGKIISYFSTKGRYNLYSNDLVYGFMACIIGLITIVFSTTIGSIFRIIIGIWIIYTSLTKMSLSLKLRTLESNVWMYTFILAIIMGICGLFVILNSGAVIMTIGVIMIVYSVVDIVEEIIFMKNVKEIF